MRVVFLRGTLIIRGASGEPRGSEGREARTHRTELPAAAALGGAGPRRQRGTAAHLGVTLLGVPPVLCREGAVEKV